MLPPKLLHFQNPSWPTHFHRFSCTNPNRPPLEQPPITATSRRTSMPSSSSLLSPASCLQQTPTSRPPPFPQPAALSPPHHPIPHQPPTNNHTIDGNTSTSFPPPLSPCRNSHILHRHFPPPSAAHRATNAPRHLLAPLPPPAPDSQIHAPVPQPPNVPPQPPTDNQQLQSILFQSDPHHHSIKPNNLMLPLNPFSLCPRQPAGRASKADLIRLHHQWHHRQPFPHPRTRGQHITTFQHNNPPPSSHHKLVPPTWVHHPPWSCSTLPRQGWTRRGAPCHCLTRTMTPLRTRGMQTTSDHAAAASEVPTMIYPGMIHTTTTPSHTLFVVFVFVHGFATAFYNTPTIIFGHWLNSVRRPTRSVSLCTTKNSASQRRVTHQPFDLDYHKKLFLDFGSIPVFLSHFFFFFHFSLWS